MEESRLVYLSACISILGLLAMLAFARSLEPQKKSLEELSGEDAGKLVSVKALVKSVSFRNGNFLVRICSRDCVSVIVFSSLAKKIGESKLYSLRRGQAIQVTGLLREYNGGLEIVPLNKDGIKVS